MQSEQQSRCSGETQIVSEPSIIATRASRGSIVLFSVGIGLFWAAMYVYTPVFAVYAESLGASLGIVGLAVGAYGLTQMVARIPLGVWSDSVGKRRIFVVGGFLVCGLAAVGFAYSGSPSGLVIFRGVMGIAAATWVCSTVLFSSYFPHEHPSVPMSIMTFSQSLGQILATSTGGLLAQHWGWIAPFWAAVGLSVIGALVIMRVPEDRTARAMAVSRESMLHTATGGALILACILGALYQFATWATVQGFTPVLAAERFAATREDLGYLVTVGTIAYSVITIFTSRFVHSFGEARTLVLGFTLMTIGILPTPLIGGLTSLAVLQIIGGVGRGLAYPLLMSMAIRTASPKDRASAMGIFQAVYALGMFLGPWLSGAVADATGLDSVFVICGILCLSCLPIAAILTPRALAHRPAASGAR